ncbi:hypothetical protein SRABI106_04356 [Rahnella aquatilis]|nr:hypothetical protein SRABI106_04356 [Rahnella aquatilis]
MNDKLIVSIVIRYTQFIREFPAVSLHDISDTGTECAFNTGQLFKHFIAGGMGGITQPLFGHFVLVLRQHGTWCARGIHQLVRHHIAAIGCRLNLTDNNSINTQRGPGCRGHFCGGGWLLRHT